MNHEFYMHHALRLARKALAAGDFPVGCAMVYEDRVIAEGFRKNSKGPAANEVDHAEIIALRQLTGRGIDPRRVTVFTTMEPCLMCLGALLISGIRNIVYAYEDVMGGGTSCDLTPLGPLYSRPAVNIVAHVLRLESLALFAAFFRNPENSYWKDSQLATYTLNQFPG